MILWNELLTITNGPQWHYTYQGHFIKLWLAIRCNRCSIKLLLCSQILCAKSLRNQQQILGHFILLFSTLVTNKWQVTSGDFNDKILLILWQHYFKLPQLNILISVLLLVNCMNTRGKSSTGGGKTIYFSSLAETDIAWRWLHTIVAYLFHPRGQSTDHGEFEMSCQSKLYLTLCIIFQLGSFKFILHCMNEFFCLFFSLV